MTERGRDVERIMMQRSVELERAWARQLGKHRLEELRELLRDLDDIETHAVI